MLKLTNPSQLQMAYTEAKHNYLKFKEEVKKLEKQHEEYLAFLEAYLIAEFPVHGKPQICGNYAITKEVNDEYSLKDKNSLAQFKEDLQKLYSQPSYGEALFNNIVSIGTPSINILKSPLRQIQSMPELYPQDTLNVIAKYIDRKISTEFKVREVK